MPEKAPLLDHVAANVRRVRERQGVTQQQLADRLGIGLRYFQRLETAQVNFTIEVLERLADTLGVPPTQLVRRNRIPPRRPPGRPRGRGR